MRRPRPKLRVGLLWAGLLWAGAALLLSACNPFAPFRPGETDLLQAGLVEPDRLAAPAPVFCYRTLAKPDCFREPQRGEGNRFVGGYLPVRVIE